MKLTALRLHNVKRFGGQGVAIEGIGDGVNVLSAPNEYGKSTCFEALHALFFQPHTGTPKPVQLLRPYSGGSPLVEADIATDAGHYRLTKQYYAGKRATVTDLDTGRLIAQADEAEAFIADLTRGGSAGPAGLLWVRQGITGIERRSNSEEESETRVRESVLTSVQGEVESLTGGRRMAEIAAACEEELFKLVTATLKPKTGGRYATALGDRDRLLAEEQRLAAEVTTLREALDQRRRTRARLAEIENPEEEAARLAAVTAAEAAFEAAKSHHEALKAAEAEAALARHRHEAAQMALEAFVAASQQADILEQRLVPLQRHRDDALARRESAAADNDRAAAAIQLAETEERENRQLLSRLETALRARDAAEQLKQLRSRLQQADRARLQVEEAEAALAILALSDTALEQLQALDLELVRLKAAQDATLPTWRLDPAPNAGAQVSLDGRPIEAGRDHTFSGAARLDIAGVGSLTLRSNRPAQAGQAMEQVAAKHKALLASLGVESLAAARQRQALARDKTSELDLARQRLADLAPRGLVPLQAEIARLAELDAEALELKGDPELARQAHAVSEQQVSATRNAAREIQPILGLAVNALLDAETALAANAAERASLESQLGPAAERPARQRALAEGNAASLAEHERAEAHAASLRSAGHDLAAADTALRRARSVQQAAVQEVNQLRMTLADLNGHINGRADAAIEEVWQETAGQLAAAQASVDALETEIAVLDRLRQALATARSAARDLYLKPVLTELRPLIGLLFDDIAIEFDEETLLPNRVRRKGQDEDVDRLSGGMREQLSVLTRLAFARLLARDGRPAPVILDDALVYSDDDRIERMFDALHQQSQDQQILVFSCRQRAFARLGGNVLHMQAWIPAV
ncbi:AAA family ATPase [Devosia lacusdianchii]|uniref:AAA family ATPase n=1 Tax=Devosia lacusdianchii TaxID=2917991 RepID=UPI001F061C24|nr:AAA family ATPase [Devosia sp. JXJ CY 41]